MSHLFRTRSEFSSHDLHLLTSDFLDSLVYTAQFARDPLVKARAQEMIYEGARIHGIYCASLYDLYLARTTDTWSNFSVPACNIRTLTYDISETFHSAMKTHAIGPVIFEIALSEQKYTSQTHKEYATAILAGCLKAHYSGPVFLLGDHYQVNKEAFINDKPAELARLRDEIRSAIAAGFYNIDIDASTIVNLDLPYETDQQKDNCEVTAYLTKIIRELEPESINIAIGGEIGHIGGVNSTSADFEAFIQGYTSLLPADMKGLSKIALQTGTRHGGTPLQDGSILDVDVDSSLHVQIGLQARRYGIGGTVQHGASTLPEDKLHIFPDSQTLEVHLATGWQNTIYDALPETMRESMYKWLRIQFKDEIEQAESETQGIYLQRKKAFGHFKEELWNMSLSDRKHIMNSLHAQFIRIAQHLNVVQTRPIIDSLYKS